MWQYWVQIETTVHKRYWCAVKWHVMDCLLHSGWNSPTFCSVHLLCSVLYIIESLLASNLIEIPFQLILFSERYVFLKQRNICSFSKINRQQYLHVRLPALVIKEIPLPSLSLIIIYFGFSLPPALISSRPCLSLFLQPSISVPFLSLSNLYSLPLSLLRHLILPSALLPLWPLSIYVNNHLISAR